MSPVRAKQSHIPWHSVSEMSHSRVSGQSQSSRHKTQPWTLVTEQRVLPVMCDTTGKGVLEGYPETALPLLGLCHTARNGQQLPEGCWSVDLMASLLQHFLSVTAKVALRDFKEFIVMSALTFAIIEASSSQAFWFHYSFTLLKLKT